MPSEASKIVLPPAPAEISDRPVRAWWAATEIDTYETALPDPYPAYLDQRVYQGSSGAVYPMPFIERVSQEKEPREWRAVHIENEFVRLMILPDLGGRIHIGLDKTRDYDFFYRNDVIKPALVGLAGPWISGGVEFNWPQHHRPATYLPCEVSIEEEPDGAITVWCSDHDPFARMQGMHGIRLRPHSALIEVRGQVVNRTEDVQTFLWWANVAAAVNDDYQSFFPTDVRVVADHAKRAMSSFPAAKARYYGVDYPARRTPERPDGDRLDWYRNIPVPTSYMCLQTEDDFFGGYDHGVGAGFVHWADHRIAPGKKQWTWGNAPFGWAWDAQLTDTNGPYVELMAGVYTDNQPDFGFLKPGETRTFSQYWYPIQDIGPVHQANRESAVRLQVDHDVEDTLVQIAVGTTQRRPGTVISLLVGERVVSRESADPEPGAPYLSELTLPGIVDPADCEVVVQQGTRDLIRWRPRRGHTAEVGAALPASASEPADPEFIASVDELYLTGIHLAQYRHATRSPEPYWQEGLRRDPGDARCHLAIGIRRLHDGRPALAQRHFAAATARLTQLNPNPRDGEAHYRLGQVNARLGRFDDARNAFAVAMWDRTWLDAATVAHARLDLLEGLTQRATEDLQALLGRSPQFLQARNLAVVAALRNNNPAQAEQIVRETLAFNPLDAWARDLARFSLGDNGRPTSDDPTILLDVAREYLSIGENDSAVRLLETAAALPVAPGRTNVAALALLHRVDLEFRSGDEASALRTLDRARAVNSTWCFPATYDNDVLDRLRMRLPGDALITALHGHWLYAAGRRDEAILAWSQSIEAGAENAVVLRNLGLAVQNVHGASDRAASYYTRALEAAPHDARLLFEADQLDGLRAVDPGRRLATLEKRGDLVNQRDDLSIQFAELLTAQGRAAESVAFLTGRVFQPWEGGEGRVLGAWEQAHLALARTALGAGDPPQAVNYARRALSPIASLGEARHELANTAQMYLTLGDALAADGQQEAAREAWTAAATQSGDFQGMRVQTCSERTAASVWALRRLGRTADAQRLCNDLAAYVEEQEQHTPRIDYFATSLPSMLLFARNIAETNRDRCLVFRAQLADLDNRSSDAAALAAEVLRRDPLNPVALGLTPLAVTAG